jgi:hypothetical protein
MMDFLECRLSPVGFFCLQPPFLYVGARKICPMRQFFMRILNILSLFFCLSLLPSCDSNTNTPKTKAIEKDDLLPPERSCGSPALVDVRDENRSSVGVLETLNDNENLWLIYSPNISNRLIKAHLYIGPEESVPRDGRGNDLMSEFPIKVLNEAGAIGWVYHFPLDSLPECFVIVACLHIADRELVRPLPNQVSYVWSSSNSDNSGLHSIAFCPGKCDPAANLCSGGLVAGQFRTFTATDWAEELKGSPWSEYLDSKFTEAFPDGLILGCEKKVVFNSGDAVRAFLPSQGSGRELEESVEDPANSGNGLAGEICALSLSIGFDLLDNKFSQSAAKLNTLIVATGPFAGWNVRDLISEANTVLGGCASNYSPGQMEEVIRNVNENFSGAVVNQKFLRCEGG